jgi:methionine-rich copper-binding protein CopC
VKTSLRRARTAGALAALLALSAVAGTVPAQAHDALASSSPANGQTITTNPGKVSITLTNAPDTRLPGSNSIKVTAPDGHVVSAGEPTADGNTLSTDADIDHPGKHTVEWRAVSADGHPIDGTFSFTDTPEPGASEGTGHAEGTGTHEGSAATTAPAAAAATTPSPEAQAATPAAAQSADNAGLFIGLGAVLLVLVAVGAYLIGRRTKAAASKAD